MVAFYAKIDTKCKIVYMRREEVGIICGLYEAGNCRIFIADQM